MAVPRLPFLYPNLMRAVRSCEPNTYRSIRIPSGSSSTTTTAKASFHTSRRRQQETYHRRYGPAVEANLPPPSRPKEGSVNQPAGKDSSNSTPSEESRQQPESSPPSKSKDQQATTSSHDKSNTPVESEAQDEHEHDDEAAAVEFTPAANTSGDRTSPPPRNMNENPLEEVLHMPSPSASLTPSGVSAADDRKLPHLSPPPYVHHFDTYSLVRDLEKGGFSDEQSVTIMKAVRNILQKNLDLARQSLTSKSDVENESYLFKAACSELQSSLQTARNSEVQRQRASRTQLQHEADIISQRLNQELAGLKDDIKGMFNDHKMTTREMQRSIDTSVQELNYKITVSLNSDGKSEIEGLRWILTRRAALAVATSAFMIICFLKYYSYRMAQEAQKAKEAATAAAKELPESRPKHAAVQTEVPIHAITVPEAHISESLG